MKPTAVGITWYRREADYVRLKAMFTDGEKLPDTYNEWLQEAKKVSDFLTLEGFNVVRVYLDPKTLSAWCKTQNYEMDATARSLYATDFVAGKI
jgi:hypothetical protein